MLSKSPIKTSDGVSRHASRLDTSVDMGFSCLGLESVSETCRGSVSNVNVSSCVNSKLKPRLHDKTCCQTGCQSGLTTGCIVYTNIHPVVKPVWQPVWQPAVSCKQTSNRLSHRSIGCLFTRYNRFAKPVVQPVSQPVVSCKRGITVHVQHELVLNVRLVRADYLLARASSTN